MKLNLWSVIATKQCYNDFTLYPINAWYRPTLLNRLSAIPSTQMDSNGCQSDFLYSSTLLDNLDFSKSGIESNKHMYELYGSDLNKQFHVFTLSYVALKAVQ